MSTIKIYDSLDKPALLTLDRHQDEILVTLPEPVEKELPDGLTQNRYHAAGTRTKGKLTIRGPFVPGDRKTTIDGLHRHEAIIATNGMESIQFSIWYPGFEGLGDSEVMTGEFTSCDKKS